MSTPGIDGLEQKIDQGKLKVGNQVLASTGGATSNSQLLYVDSGGNLAQNTTLPFSLTGATGFAQSTVTSPLFTFAGKAVTDVLVNTLVTGASVTTATKAGFVRVNVTSDDDTLVGGNYYIELFTIT